MTRTLWIAAIACFFAGSAAQAELRHRYSFNDGTANDSVGDAHGTLENGATVADGSLVLSKAANGYNGRGDYAALDAGKIGVSRYQQLTLELWVTVDPVEENLWVVGATLGKAGDLSNQFGMNYVAVQMCRAAAAEGDQAAISDVSWVEERRIMPDGKDLADGEQHYVAVVVDEETLAYYVDGHHAGSAPLDGMTLADLSDDDAFLGRSTFSGDNTLVGAIDEFRISDDAKDGAYFKRAAELGPDKLAE